MHPEAVTLLQRLIACDTSNPPGNEAQAAAIVEGFLAPLGVRCERVAKDPRRPNLVATLPGSGDGPSLAFLGHLDVVQARREDWSVEPFAGVERDGSIWGRGAVDMKCQVAATVVALATLAREGRVPGGDLSVILCADEEVGDAGVGAPFLVEARPDLMPDFVVGEGAGERYDTGSGPVYLLDRGVKATSTVTLTVRGRSGDASLAANHAHNAALELGRLLDRLSRHEWPRRVLPEVEELAALDAPAPLADVVDSLLRNVVGVTQLEARGPANVVPEQATANLSCLVLPGVTAAGLEEELREALGPGAYELEVEEPLGGLTSPLDTPLHRAIESFLAERDPDARLVPVLGYGYSDCHTLREAYGSVAYGFVPFRHADPTVNLTTKHGADERVFVEDVAFQVDAALAVARSIGSL